MKPRIRYIAKPSMFGVPCRPFYLCDDEIATGYGETAKEAYCDWLEDRPKTAIGRIGRWVLVKIFGL